MKVKISKLKANPNNPRIIRDENFTRLVKSIKEFPSMLEKRPLVVFTDQADGKLVVLGGNMRYRAAIEVGLKEVPVISADDWTEEERDEFVIKDNVTFGDWNWESLANEWEQEALIDWGIPAYNFGTKATPLTFDSDVTYEEKPEAVEIPPANAPKITDAGFVRFELVLQENQKKVVLDALNHIQDQQNVSLGEALHLMAESYILNEISITGTKKK